MSKINLTLPTMLFFFCGIGCFILAYLHFKGKLSVRWRSGFFYAQKDEQKHPDFKVRSKVQAFTIFFGGIASILFGFHQLYHQNWMIAAVIILFFAIVISGIINIIIFGCREKKRK